jgi:hypothetical protein
MQTESRGNCADDEATQPPHNKDERMVAEITGRILDRHLAHFDRKEKSAWTGIS